MNRIFVTSILVALVGATVATATHQEGCAADGPLGFQEIPTPAGTFYIDDREWEDVDMDGNAEGIWIYQESNNVPGLQTGGTGVLDTTTGEDLGSTDTCTHENPDTLIF